MLHWIFKGGVNFGNIRKIQKNNLNLNLSLTPKRRSRRPPPGFGFFLPHFELLLPQPVTAGHSPAPHIASPPSQQTTTQPLTLLPQRRRTGHSPFLSQTQPRTLPFWFSSSSAGSTISFSLWNRKPVVVSSSFPYLPFPSVFNLQRTEPTTGAADLLLPLLLLAISRTHGSHSSFPTAGSLSPDHSLPSPSRRP